MNTIGIACRRLKQFGHFLPAKPRIKPVLQSQTAECGLAVMAMVASAYGHRYSMSVLRRRFPISTYGVSLKTLTEIADQLGFSARAVRVDLDELSALTMPAILHWDFNHFVVLEKVRRKRALIHDPASGARWLKLTEVSIHFTGVALDVLPASPITPDRGNDRTTISDLISNPKSLVSGLAHLIALAMLLQGISLALPVINQEIVDQGIKHSDIGLIKTLAAGIVVLVTFSAAVQFLSAIFSIYLGTQLSFQMQSNVFRHMLRLSTEWFESRNLGDIISRFGSLTAIQDVIANAPAVAIISSLSAAFSAVMMTVYSPVLSGCATATILFLVCTRILFYPYYRRRYNEGLHLGAKVQTTFLETVRGARAVKIFGAEQERISIWQDELSAQMNNQIQQLQFSAIGGAGLAILNGVQQTAIWSIGAIMVVHSKMTLGMLFAFQGYSSQFGTNVTLLVAQFFRVKSLRVHLDRLSDVTALNPEDGLDSPPHPSGCLVGAVELSNVTYRYGLAQKPTLDGVSLTVRSGEFVGITGPSGHGKTTLIKAILGLIRPESGDILIDDVSLYNINITQYRKNIGVVLQDDILFRGSIEQNISFFGQNMSSDAVIQAAQKARAHEFISELPMGYRTIVGDIGANLSAGQRQRIILARALYHKPAILLLDEGTANLDMLLERDVMRSIASMSMTRIIIAHRQEAFFGADRILNFREGRIIGATS